MGFPHSVLVGLTRRYCEPHRAYHTIGHVADMLWRGREMDLDDAQVLAIWYHDAIYDVPASDNEERSAELARAELAGWPDVDRVAQMVLDTKTHVPTVAGADLVIDLDLASLAVDWEAFCVNTANIRAEYAMYNDADFQVGQSRVFERFLERDRIYHTEWGSKLEASARENMGRYVATGTS